MLTLLICCHEARNEAASGQSERHLNLGLRVEFVLGEPASHAQVPQQPIGESHLLHVLCELRDGAVAIEEDREAIRVVNAEHHEVPSRIARAGIAEVEERRNSALRAPEQYLIGLEVAVDERQTWLLVQIE